MKLSKAQSRVIEALNKPGTRMIAPFDSPGKRTGYVSNGGIHGYICAVTLKTMQFLIKANLD